MLLLSVVLPTNRLTLKKNSFNFWPQPWFEFNPDGTDNDRTSTYMITAWKRPDLFTVNPCKWMIGHELSVNDIWVVCVCGGREGEGL